MIKQKIFDINIHISTDETFSEYKLNMPCNIDTYKKFIDPSLDFVGGLLVGLPNVGNYCDQSFIQKSTELQLPALAAITNECLINIDSSMYKIKRMGFLGVKFHQRLLNIDNIDDELKEIALSCKKYNLVLAICTYQKESEQILKDIKILSLIEDISSINIKIILMHSGGYRFLDFYDFCSSRRNIILDTSFTLKRYESTEVINNIIIALNKGKKNIVFGSDFPDYNLSDYSKSLKKITSCIYSKSLTNNFMYKTAIDFLEINT